MMNATYQDFPYLINLIFVRFQNSGTLLVFPFAKPWVLNHFQSWDHIHPNLSTRGPQGYKRGQFIETARHCIKIGTKLGQVLQNGSPITQIFFSLSK
jgi:hypothetical protein